MKSNRELLNKFTINIEKKLKDDQQRKFLEGASRLVTLAPPLKLALGYTQRNYPDYQFGRIFYKMIVLGPWGIMDHENSAADCRSYSQREDPFKGVVLARQESCEQGSDRSSSIPQLITFYRPFASGRNYSSFCLCRDDYNITWAIIGIGTFSYPSSYEDVTDALTVSPSSDPDAHLSGENQGIFIENPFFPEDLNRTEEGIVKQDGGREFKGIKSGRGFVLGVGIE